MNPHYLTQSRSRYNNISKILAAIEDVIEERAAVPEYVVTGQSVKRMPMADLIKWHNTYLGYKAQAEVDAKAKAAGLSRPRQTSVMPIEDKRRIFAAPRWWSRIHRFEAISLGIVLALLIAGAVWTAWIRAAGKPCDIPPAGWILSGEPDARPCVYRPVKS